MEYIQSVDNTRDPTQNGQTDVDQQVSTTAALQEDTQRGEDDGKNDFADITMESQQWWSWSYGHMVRLEV